MPALSNPRHERFAQALAMGKPQIRAYTEAGYKKDDGAAARLSRNAKVQERVTQILTAAATRVEITAARVLEELAKIGFADMGDYLRVGPDGDFHTDFSNIRPDQTAAIAEVTVEDFKDGRGPDARDVRRVKFKLHDKQAALVNIGKHLGMFKDRVEHSGHVSIGERDPDKARELILQHLERADQLRLTHQPAADKAAA